MGNIKIGITERGDAGIDTRWYAKLNTVDGVILITKNITDTFIDAVMQAYSDNKPVIIHATTTGWGGSVIEPNVPTFDKQLMQVRKLIDKGFPAKNIVIRIDPVIPVPDGIGLAARVIDKALELNILPEARVRISVLDNYPHVRERFMKAGFQPLYDNRFTAPRYVFEEIEKTFEKYAYMHIIFETCAEPLFPKCDFIKASGCISETDLQIMNLPLPEKSEKSYQRGDCLCLNIKTELLTEKKRCPHKCLYCFWKD